MTASNLPDFNGDLVIKAVNEFYETTDKQRRHELDTVLCQFKSDFDCVRTVATCFQMINSPESNSNVRYFGTVSLYQVIRLRSEEFVSNEALLMNVKTFLIDSLTAGTTKLTQSVLNKLSSTLAILALNCIPDLWTEPVADMTAMWAATPELLLRVLSDLAAEFQHIQMPLSQRSKLKTELHRISSDIIKIIWTVLSCGDATPSTKQAAVDCVEQWIRLPGVALENWSQVLSVVLEAVSKDCAALTNILDILGENDELDTMHQLLLDICNYIVLHVSQKVYEELENDATSEEAVSLVAATCCVATKAVANLVDVATQAGNPELLMRMIQVMQGLVVLPGKYPLEEKVSDLPTFFFTSLGGEIKSVRADNKCNDQLYTVISQAFAQNLEVAIFKITYPTDEEFKKWTAEDQELLDSYRSMRSDLSMNSFLLSGDETLLFLNSKLEEALNNWDVNRSEACLYFWGSVADYLSEANYSAILNCLQIIATRLSISEEEKLNRDTERRGNTLMKLLYALSHLVQEHDNARELEGAIIPIILGYLPKLDDAREAIHTLQKYLDGRPESLKDVGEQISNTCYAFFNDTNRTKKLRLEALKCIGNVLSVRNPKDTMEIIYQIVNNQMTMLNNMDGLDAETQIERYSFQINIFTALFSSLGKKGEEPSDGGEPAVVTILKEATQLFERIVDLSPPVKVLMDDTCDAVKNAIQALPSNYVPHFFPFVRNLLSRGLITNSCQATSLAKTTALVTDKVCPSEFCDAVCEWFELIERTPNEGQLEDWLVLMQHIFRRGWKVMRKYEQQSIRAIQSAVNVCLITIVQSSEPTVVRTAAQILASIATNATTTNDAPVKELLAKCGGDLIKAIFSRIQCELIRPTVEALSEVLFFYFKEFTSETRSVMNTEPYGQSPLVAALFREIGNLRNFKQMTIRLNLAALRDAGTTA